MMEPQNSWRIIAASVFVALLFVGVAAVSAQSTQTDKTASVVAVEAPAEDSGEWREALTALSPQTVTETGEYRAPRELPASEAISRELLTSYLTLKSDGKLTQAEQQAAIQQIIGRNITPVTAPERYSMNTIVVSETTTLEVYAGAVTRILSRSAEIKEYELTSFARAVGEGTSAGVPNLARAATTYRGMETALATLPVPPTVASEHLAVLESIASIAYVTDLMARWNGDPLVALSFVDAFAASERDVQLSLNGLYRTIRSVAERS